MKKSDENGAKKGDSFRPATKSDDNAYQPVYPGRNAGNNDFNISYNTGGVASNNGGSANRPAHMVNQGSTVKPGSGAVKPGNTVKPGSGSAEKPSTPGVNPEIPGETPGGAEKPEAPETPGSPETPGVTPETPGDPGKTPGEGEGPVVPQTPETPETPESPETPGETETPENPGGTETPENPEIPGETPGETPGVTPETPETPENPGGTVEVPEHAEKLAEAEANLAVKKAELENAQKSLDQAKEWESITSAKYQQAVDRVKKAEKAVSEAQANADKMNEAYAGAEAIFDQINGIYENSVVKKADAQKTAENASNALKTAQDRVRQAQDNLDRAKAGENVGDTTEIDWNSLTKEQKEQAIATVLVYKINQYRMNAGLEPLYNLDILNKRAYDWSVEMVKAGDLSHDPTIHDGSGIIDRDRHDWYTQNENVAYRYHANVDDDADGLFLQWKNSKTGHNENMLNNNTQTIGVGVVIDEKTGRVYATMKQVGFAVNDKQGNPIDLPEGRLYGDLEKEWNLKPSKSTDYDNGYIVNRITGGRYYDKISQGSRWSEYHGPKVKDVVPNPTGENAGGTADVAELEKALSEAKDNEAKATVDKENADKDLQQAEIDLDAHTKAKDDAQEDVDYTKGLKEQAEENLNEATAERDSAVTEQNQANTELEEATSAVEYATENVETAEKAVEDAQAEVDKIKAEAPAEDGEGATADNGESDPTEDVTETDVEVAE